MRKYNIVSRRLYNCWNGMKRRCNSPNNKDSKYYYGKGITYCEEWKDYHAFQDWALSHGYADDLTLDRIDGNCSYCPENCRWITIQEQQRNRSSCLYFTHDGETRTLAEWARIFGINRATLHDRIFLLGYSFEDAISTNQRLLGKYTIEIEYAGKTYTQSQFVKKFRTSHKRVSELRNKGYSVERIVHELTNNYKPKTRNKSCKIFVEYNGEKHSLKKWSEITEIPYHVLLKRYHSQNWCTEKMLTTPPIESFRRIKERK